MKQKNPIKLQTLLDLITAFYIIRCHTEWSKSDREEEISYDIPYMWNLKRNETNELSYKTERDSQT